MRIQSSVHAEQLRGGMSAVLAGTNKPLVNDIKTIDPAPHAGNLKGQQVRLCFFSKIMWWLLR